MLRQLNFKLYIFVYNSIYIMYFVDTYLLIISNWNWINKMYCINIYDNLFIYHWYLFEQQRPPGGSFAELVRISKSTRM